jgi:hypothetical protein
VEQAAVAQVDLCGLAQPFLQVDVEGRQLPQQVSSFQDFHVPLNGLVAHSDDLTRLRMVPVLPVLVGDELNETTPLLVAQVRFGQQRKVPQRELLSFSLLAPSDAITCWPGE